MNNKIREYYNQFLQIVNICRYILDGRSLLSSVIALAFIRRVDCLIHLKAKECEAFYDENHTRLSNERLDEELRKIVGGLPFYNVSGYTLCSVFRSENSQEVALNSYVNGFSTNVRQILYSLNFERIVAMFRNQPSLLGALISKLMEIEMSECCLKNDEFEELIAYLKAEINASDGRKMDDGLTPEALSTLMVSLLMSKNYFQNSSLKPLSIYDPVCGTGDLLVKAQKRALPFVGNNDAIKVSGQDLNPVMVAISNAMLLLNNNENNIVKCGDTLLEDCFQKQNFNYITGIFPFGYSWKNIKGQIEREAAFGRFSMGLPSVNDSQFLFMQHMISKMDPSGARIVTLTTGNAVFGGSINSGENIIRRKMIESDLVETIISLPTGTLYPTTSIPVFLWILSNKKEDSRKGKIQLIDGKDFVSKQRGEYTINESSIKRIISEYNNYSETEYSRTILNEDVLYFQISLYHSGSKKADVRQIPANANITEYIANEIQPYIEGNVKIDYSSVKKGCSIYFNEFFEERIKELSLKNTFNVVDELTSEIIVFRNRIREINSLNGYTKLREVKSPLYSAIPFDWNEMPMNIIANVVKGQEKPYGEENEDGIPYIVLSLLRGDEDKISRYLPTAKNKLLSEKDVVVVVNGFNCGEVFVGMDGILSQWLVMLQPTEMVNPKYLYYLIKAHERLLKSMKKGSGMPYIAINTLKTMKFYIPSMEEQNSIVLLLDDVTRSIDRICNLLGSKNNTYTTYRQAFIENVVFGKIKTN